jgi:hypothetical protein
VPAIVTGADLVVAALQVHRCARLRVRGQARDAALQLAHVGAVVGTDEEVGEVEAAVDERDAVDAHVARRGLAAGGAARARAGVAVRSCCTLSLPSALRMRREYTWSTTISATAR